MTKAIYNCTPDFYDEKGALSLTGLYDASGHIIPERLSNYIVDSEERAKFEQSLKDPK